MGNAFAMFRLDDNTPNTIFFHEAVDYPPLLSPCLHRVPKAIP